MSGKLKQDLTGMRFGKLTVISKGDFRSRAQQWVCKCDCGNITEASTSHLRSGHTKSCGCLRHEGGKEVRDLTGQRFGKLVAVKENGRTKQGQAMWLCKCDCGNTKTIASASLTHGLTVSCGCYNSERTIKKNLKHGDAFRRNKTRLYEVWCAMIKRCENPHDSNYKYYGGRGILIADEWHDYKVFKEWALRNGYDEAAERGDCTIDRIDVDGNYEPCNCRWTDWKTQMNNTRRNKAYKERERNNG